MSPHERVAAWSTVAAVAAIVTCPALLALDLHTYVAIQALPSVRVHAFAFALDIGARVLLGVMIALALLDDPNSRRRVSSALALVASGAAFGELLKTAIERLRPSALPGLIAGNSMPSGHVMNTTLVAVVAWDLAGCFGPRRARAARAVAMGAVAMQAASRVLRGSHWASDLLPSILIAIAWMTGAGSLWRARWLRVPLVAGAVAAYVVLWATPALRIHVPSVLDRPRVTLAAWQRDTSGRPFGASNVPAAKEETGFRAETLAAGGGTPGVVEAVLRSSCGVPHTPRCRRVRLAVNGWTSPEIGLGCGWRWYRVQPPTEMLHSGANSVAIFVPEGCAARDIEHVLVRSVALVSESDATAKANDHIAGSGTHCGRHTS